MTAYLVTVATVAAIASVARLIVAILDYRRRWRPCPEVDIDPHDIQIYPDGSWSTPTGWRNR